MSNRFTTEYLLHALNRAIRTFCQVGVSMVTVGQAFTEVNWPHIISVAVTAAVVSILMSIGKEVPEAKSDGELQIDTNNPDKDVFRLDVGDLANITGKKKVTLKVNPKANLGA